MDVACGPHEFDVSLDSWCINSLFEKEKYTRKVSAFIMQARIHFDRNSKWHWKWSICRTPDVTNFFLNFKLLFFRFSYQKKYYEFASYESIMKVFHSIKFSCFIFQHIYSKLPIFRLFFRRRPYNLYFSNKCQRNTFNVAIHRCWCNSLIAIILKSYKLHTELM